MSNSNPTLAINAILPVKKMAGGYEIHNLKLGTMAILEKIESPYVTGGVKMTDFNMAGTMFVMTHPFRDSLMAIDNNTFPEVALEWLDSLDRDAAAEILTAILELMDVQMLPEAAEPLDEEKKS